MAYHTADSSFCLNPMTDHPNILKIDENGNLQCNGTTLEKPVDPSPLHVCNEMILPIEFEDNFDGETCGAFEYSSVNNNFYFSTCTECTNNNTHYLNEAGQICVARNNEEGCKVSTLDTHADECDTCEGQYLYSDVGNYCAAADAIPDCNVYKDH